MELINSIKNEREIYPLAVTDISKVVNTTGATLGQNFANWSLALNNNDSEPAAHNNTTEEIQHVQSILNGLQGNLLVALGLHNLNDDSIDQLTSESTLSMMQAALLSSLQASFFNPSSTQTDDTTMQVDNKKVSSFEDSLQDIYQYAFGAEGACINNVFDTINPLNHIPVIADEYQKASSTTVSPFSNIVGGYAYGGPLGMGLAAANLAVESLTGKSIYKNVKDYFLDDSQQALAEPTTTKISQELDQANKAHHFVKRAI